MPGPDPIEDVVLLIRSRYPMVHIESGEESRVESILRIVADKLDLGLFSWSPTKGLHRLDPPEDGGAKGAVYGTSEPGAALAHIASSGFAALYYLPRFSHHLEDPAVIAGLVEVSGLLSKSAGAIVFSGAEAALPQELASACARVELAEPGTEDFRQLLTHILRDLYTRQDIEMHMTDAELNVLLANMRGLTLTEAEKVLTKVIIEDGVLSPSDIRSVMEAKRDIALGDGLLEYYPLEETMADIADLKGLKGWLAKRKRILADPDKAADFGLDFPKGVLLLGVPGCGKSLCAKAVAMEWGLPLLKLDPGRIYNKYLGESEKNFARAVRTAEKMSPVVLWIDEIEKAFSSVSGDQDGGASMRMFGTFLTWMQDRRGDVFTVATANDVSRLPPELLRKGRFDEIFFVDLPDEESRSAIFEIHLGKRGKAPGGFDIPLLCAATTGFSGSEIEQVVVSGLYTAFAAGTELTTDIMLEEAAATSPISRTMAERISALREWARGRTVIAH